MENHFDPDLTHSMAHYLLAIHKLKEKKGYARVTDISKDMGITKGSVSIAINNLKKKGLVLEEEDSKFLLLSDKGHDEVHRILSSRTLIFYFLKDFLGVTEENSHRDSCLMEHLMSEETRDRFFDFMKDFACSCEEKRPMKNNFKTELDFCDFKDAHDFIERQKGDKHLD